ncbi:MAG: T9SS type A sorting domain-containing protein [Bacteroidetes bacterium]|nr:T9SS type A sorting domain-containing protein [Bacteroidota bacterium]
MKKLYVAALFLCFYGFSDAQITITRNDMPSIRDTARYSTTNNNIDITTTGPNVIWDFSNLVINGQGIDSFRSILSVNPLYVLSFNILDYAIRNDAFPAIAQLQISNQYSFYKKSNSYLEIEGFGAEFNGIPLPAAYDVPDKVYQFPLTYGRKDTTPYELTISIPSLGSLHMVGRRFNNVDGWGMVITPYDTFQCLRLRSYQQETDSFTIDALGTTIGVPNNKITYQWLANGQKIPVVEVTGNDQFGFYTVTKRRFRDGFRLPPPPFTVQADFRANHTTCTTRDTISLINRSTPFVAGTAYRYTITPNTFNYVLGTNDTYASPKVNFTAPGLYTVSLHIVSPTGGTPASGDTTKVDYITVTWPTAVSDLNKDMALEIYPNPVSDVLTVRTAEPITELTLINTLGQRVMTRTNESRSVSFSVRSFEEGTYLLEVVTASGRQLQKVVIQ